MLRTMEVGAKRDGHRKVAGGSEERSALTNCVFFFRRKKSRKSVSSVHQQNEDLTWALNLARPDSSGATHASLHAQQACHHRQRALHEGLATSADLSADCVLEGFSLMLSKIAGETSDEQFL